MTKENEYYKSGEHLKNLREAQIKAVALHKLKKLERDRAKLEEYINNPKICIGCGSIHDFARRNNKYCTASCGTRTSNANRSPRSVESRSKTAETIRNKPENVAIRELRALIRDKCQTCNSIIGSTAQKRKYCDNPECRFEQRSISSKKGRRTSKDNGTFKGWSARTLAPSYPEQYFIDLFANEKLCNYTRELKVGRWFIDFAFSELMIAIEIDGAQHKLEDRKKSDEIKDEFLISKGWKVFRIEWFNPINKKNREKLYRQIDAMKLLF